MPIVSFWNPTGIAQTGTTASMCAIANGIAIKHPRYKILLAQTHFNDQKMEGGYFSMAKMKRKGNMDDITDIGVDALERLLRSNKITPDSIKTYSKPCGMTIDILYGSFKGDSDSFRRVLETIPFTLDYASQYYDMVFVDLTKGTDIKEVNDILSKSDLIVTTMNQDLPVINKMEEAYNTMKILQDKPTLFVFSRYDRFLRYNCRNIFRTFNFKVDKRDTYTIPYNSDFFDSMNDGESFSFFVNNMNADVATTRNGYFISEAVKTSEKLLSLLGDKVVKK